MADNQQAAGTGNPNQPQFALQRIYIKDLSFESPNAPLVFQEQWKPHVNLDLNTSHTKISDNQFEVVLSLTITAKLEEKVAYLIEVQQAGVFMVQGIEGPQLGQMLGAYCPTILFPYARETIDSVVNKGSYPGLMLAPVNFDAIYAQALQRQQQEAEAQVEEEKTH
ncbi:MAG: protein-export chaperone SecB [Marinobacter sp.]|nr:protein-export chaperone SecB [Marinobacter sp.]